LARINANVKSDVIGLDEAMQKIASTALEELDLPVRSATGWGLPCIDDAVGLLMRGELIVIGADPGSGKTAFVTQIATHAASSGKRTFFASLEMQAAELGERELCRAADVDSRKFRSGGLSRGMIERMKCIADNHGESPVRIWSPSVATISQIRGMAKHEHSKNPLSLVIVDYLQIVEGEPHERNENRATRVGNVCSGLRQLAKELAVPVIALSQLNRKDRKAGVAPTMANLRESGDIEAASNVIAFLHQTEERKQGMPVNTQFVVGKCRAGEIGGISLVFHPKETIFTEPSAPVQAEPEKRNKSLDDYNQFF
jgi:replicative DNA helicase